MTAMSRFALKIEYDGGPFHGWQRQPDLTSVQGSIEQALAKIDPTSPLLAAAGRTDTGVHANGQVAHVDLARDWDAHSLMGALNYHLKPNPIAIVEAAEVSEDFHARFSATERHYVFRLISRRAPTVHDIGKAWQVRHELNVELMRKGASYLIGQHDFTTFRAIGCQAKSPIKNLDMLDITEHTYPGGVEYRFHVRARSFLHNQVRSFVGTLERVGAGSWTPEKVNDALALRNRAACGTVSPPHGLYLDHVVYPEDPFF